MKLLKVSLIGFP